MTAEPAKSNQLDESHTSDGDLPEEYVLGTNQAELQRLRLQHDIWSATSRSFLKRSGLREGARVLDLGAGPGFVTAEIRSVVGDTGEVWAADESDLWAQIQTAQIQKNDWSNVRFVQSRVEELDLPEGHFDLIFSRWLFSFLPEPRALIQRCADALKPGGVLAIQDYNHEGISSFPESAGFKAVIQAVRDLYASRGGDTWVAGRLPEHFAACGLELSDFTPNLKVGTPDSDAFRWMDAFFPAHSGSLVEQGFLSAEDCKRFLREWSELKANPNATIFTPIVMDVAAKRVSE